MEGKTRKKAIVVNTLYAFSPEEGLNALAFYAFLRGKAHKASASSTFPCVFAINGKKINPTLLNTCPLFCKLTVYKNVKDYRILERKE